MLTKKHANLRSQSTFLSTTGFRSTKEVICLPPDLKKDTKFVGKSEKKCRHSCCFMFTYGVEGQNFSKLRRYTLNNPVMQSLNANFDVSEQFSVIHVDLSQFIYFQCIRTGSTCILVAPILFLPESSQYQNWFSQCLYLRQTAESPSWAAAVPERCRTCHNGNVQKCFRR